MIAGLNPILDRTAGYAVSKLVSGGYQVRNQENETGLRIFYSHPWLGVGPGMVPFHFLEYHPTARTLMDTQRMDIAIYVNNLYIATLAETGVVGFIALAMCGIAGTAALVRSIQRHGAKRTPMLTALTVSLIGCAVQYWETENLFLIYFPVLIGLATAGARLAYMEAELPVSDVKSPETLPHTVWGPLNTVTAPPKALPEHLDKPAWHPQA